MFIYLDSKDLISLADNALSVETINRFNDFLLDHDAKLVYSFIHIDEMTRPLYSEGQSNVMSRCNYLESLPHVWMNISSLKKDELDVAFIQYSQGEYCKPIDPFVRSYIDTLVDVSREVRNYYRSKSLSEIIWDQMYGQKLNGFDLVAHHKVLFDRYEDLIRKDRETIQRFPNVLTATKELLYDKVVQGLTGGRINSHYELDGEDIRLSFAKYLYKNPAVCPSRRLSFEIFHVLIRDTRTKPRPSDVVGDFNHIEALPYVDVFTTDRTISHYVKVYDDIVSSKYDSPTYSPKTYKNIKEILDKLERTSVRHHAQTD